MGYVDYGKIFLFDVIRKINVIEKEVGGIIQYIGVFVVEVNGRKIIFLDIFGYEVFIVMRVRGVQVIDIVVFVVVVDDGVMLQIVEVINYVKVVNVIIIVVINKIDKLEVNFERVKQQLFEYGFILEEWGGDIVFVNVFVKKKIGIDYLFEMILFVVDFMEFKVNLNRFVCGRVIEVKFDKGRGFVVIVLIQKGILKVGDYVVVGNIWGRVRVMMDDKGQRIKEVGFFMFVEILGFEDVFVVGDEFVCVKDERIVKMVVQIRQEKFKEEKM